MARLNKSLINDLQSFTFEEKVEDSQVGLDINYLGYDKNIPNLKFLKYGTDANVNRVLFWLGSKKTDFVREPNKGGVLYELIGSLSNNTNLKEWESGIKDKFNQEFSDDMQILVLNLSANHKLKKLTINMIVMDKVTNRTFPVGTEASI